MVLMPVFSSLVASGGGGGDPDLLTDLVAWYELNSNGNDSTGNYDMTEVNSPAYTSGLLDNCFDAGGSYFSRAHAAALSPNGSFSVCFWIKGDTRINANSYYFTKDQAVFRGTEWRIQGGSSHNTIDFDVARNNGDISASITSGTIASPTSWTFVLGTYDSATNTAELFINNVSQGTDTTHSDPQINSSADLVIGGRTGSASAGACEIDQVGYWMKP